MDPTLSAKVFFVYYFINDIEALFEMSMKQGIIIASDQKLPKPSRPLNILIEFY